MAYKVIKSAENLKTPLTISIIKEVTKGYDNRTIPRYMVYFSEVGSIGLIDPRALRWTELPKEKYNLPKSVWDEFGYENYDIIEDVFLRAVKSVHEGKGNAQDKELKTKYFHVRTTNTQHDKAMKRADQEGKKLSQWIFDLIEEELNKE